MSLFYCPHYFHEQAVEGHDYIILTSFNSIACLISTFLCISIRKTSVLQQLNKRTTFNHIKEHHLGRKKKKPTGTRSEQHFRGNEFGTCSSLILHCFAIRCLDPVFPELFFSSLFSRTNGFTKGPQNCPRQQNRHSRNP